MACRVCNGHGRVLDVLQAAVLLVVLILALSMFTPVHAAEPDPHAGHVHDSTPYVPPVIIMTPAETKMYKSCIKQMKKNNVDKVWREYMCHKICKGVPLK